MKILTNEKPLGRYRVEGEPYDELYNTRSCADEVYPPGSLFYQMSEPTWLDMWLLLCPDGVIVRVWTAWPYLEELR